MATERNVVDFKIHNLTEEQFQELKAQGQIDPNAMYFTPDTTKERLDALEAKTDATNTALSQKQDIATAVNYDNISNCITEIPQDIKLEINSENKLVVKAGTTYYVPNGVGVFEKRTITADLVWNYTGTASGQRMVLIVSGPRIDCPSITSVFSGDTQPALTSVYWYDTANNVVNSVTNVLKGGQSLALGVVTLTNGVVTSIDQVFNGFGYMGNTVFVLPGTTGIAPDGRNNDGTLKNRQHKAANVLTRNYTATATMFVGFSNTGLASGAWSAYSYDAEKNIQYNNNSPFSNVCVGAIIKAESGRIIELTPKAAFRAVDYNDTDFIAHQAMPSGSAIYLSLPSDGSYFTAPSDGYLYLHKTSTASGQRVGMFEANNGPGSFAYSSGAQQAIIASLPVRKGATVLIRYSTDDAITGFTFIPAIGTK